MREQHGRPIGLGHVIVGPQVHSHHLVELAFRRGEHEDGHRAFGPDVAANGMPVGAGQLQIEHDAVGLGSEGTGRGVAPGALVGRHGVAGKLQHVGQLRAQGGIVFDEVNALGHGCLSFGDVHRCRPRRAWCSGARFGRGARAQGSGAVARARGSCAQARRQASQPIVSPRAVPAPSNFQPYATVSWLPVLLGRRARPLDSKRMGGICLRS